MKKQFIILFIILYTIACSRNNEENCAAPANPNGDSELALLMRDMTAHIEAERKRLDAGKEPGELPENHEKIKSALPTDSKQLTGNFNGFADVYLDALKAYHSSTAENHQFAFNNMIKSCISCHQEECPGPIKRIEKLMIKE
jgi:hypothetical protein